MISPHLNSGQRWLLWTAFETVLSRLVNINSQYFLKSNFGRNTRLCKCNDLHAKQTDFHETFSGFMDRKFISRWLKNIRWNTTTPFHIISIKKKFRGASTNRKIPGKCILSEKKKCSCFLHCSFLSSYYIKLQPWYFFYHCSHDIISTPKWMLHLVSKM